MPIGIVVAAAAIIMNYGFSMQYHGKMWPTAYVDKPQLEYVGVVAFIRPIRLEYTKEFHDFLNGHWIWPQSVTLALLY